MYTYIKKIFQPLFPKKPEVTGLENTLHHRFHNPELLKTALSHRSYVHSVRKKKSLESNERLEFLGDAVLDLVITEYLYNQYPEESEGSLSKMKSLIVSAKVLEVCARDWDLGKYVLLSYSEKNARGYERQSILSDTYESVLGAVYLDAGLEKAREIVSKSVVPIIDDVLSDASMANYKSELMELTQARGLGVPVFRVIKEWGPEHKKHFCMGAFIQDQEWGRGEGASKKEAEQAAGRNSLERFNNNEIQLNTQ